MKSNKNINKIVALSLITMLTAPLNVSALTKNESVFSTLNQDGSLYKTTVTNHLKVSKIEEIEDNSELEKITNINGNETFTKDGNTLKWKTDGKDIYYEGTTTKELPLDIKIKYYLDGKEIKQEDLKDKKGKVTIEISLKNKEKHYVNINGKIEEVYTPFMVMAGTIINNKENQNIEITNGKVVDTGSKSIVTAVASPGLYESLNIDNLENINKIKIEYKTTKFNMGNIYILATPKLIEKSDLSLFDNIKTLSNSMNTLQENMNKIDKASNSLAKYTKELNSGINELNKNMPSEKSNKSNETKLNNLKNTNNSTINVLISTNTNLKEQKNQIETKITEANTKKSYIESQITDMDNKIANATTAYNTYSSQLQTVNASIPALESQIANETDDTIKATLEEDLAELKGNQKVLNSTVPLLINQKNALLGTKSALEGTKAAIEGTIELLNTTKTSLDTSITANTNLASLVSGNNKVVSSSIDTISKMRKLTSGINKLANGSKKISDGSSKLSNGISKLNSEGINKLTNYSSIIKRYSNKAEALIDLSQNYKGFTNNNSNETIFISKVKTTD